MIRGRIRRGIIVRVTRSVLFRARFRITWRLGGGEGEGRGMPRLFPEIGILRAVTSHGISPTSYWIEVQFPLAISQNARARIVISRTCPPPLFASMRIPW